jgi:hypothetical protein
VNLEHSSGMTSGRNRVSRRMGGCVYTHFAEYTMLFVVSVLILAMGLRRLTSPGRLETSISGWSLSATPSNPLRLALHKSIRLLNFFPFYREVRFMNEHN